MLLSRLALLAACAAALSALPGCTAPGPVVQPDAGIAIPPDWAAPYTAESEVPAGSEGWWHRFDDPRLDAVVQQALEANPDLAVAAARVAQAEAQARIAGAALLPQAEAETTATRARQTLAGLPLPAGAGTGFITNTFGVALNVAWEADLWNRLGSRAQAADFDLLAARADAAAARVSLAGQAAKGYFAVLEAERQADLAARTLALRRATSERVRRRYEAGLVPSLDLRLALTNVSAAAAQLAARRRALQASWRQLESLVGRYPRAGLALAARLPATPPQPAAGVPAQLLARRPDLLAAERRVAAAGARIEAARAAFFPQLQLTGSTGRQGNVVADLFDPAFNTWRLAASLLAPVFDGGRRAAELELAQARLAEALASYRGVVLQAFLEAETALAADRLLQEQVQEAEEQLRMARAAAELAEQRYAAGLVDLLTVFEADRQLLDAAARVLQARRERLQNRVDLHLALGGGFAAAGEGDAP